MAFPVRTQHALRVLPLHRERASRPVDVAAFERDPLLGPQAGLGGDDHAGCVELVELGRDHVDLVGVERKDLLGPRLRVLAGVGGGVAVRYFQRTAAASACRIAEVTR